MGLRGYVVSVSITSAHPFPLALIRVLQQMSKIAREKIEGEPVVDYDAELETLYISDPFFAYFLRWGTQGI